MFVCVYMSVMRVCMCVSGMCVWINTERGGEIYVYIQLYKYRIWAVVRCRRMSVSVTWVGR